MVQPTVLDYKTVQHVNGTKQDEGKSSTRENNAFKRLRKDVGGSCC